MVLFQKSGNFFRYVPENDKSKGTSWAGPRHQKKNLMSFMIYEKLAASGAELAAKKVLGNRTKGRGGGP